VSSAPHLTVVGPEAREVAVSFVRFPKVHPASVYGHVEVRVWFDGDAAEQALGVDGYPLTFDRLAEARAEVEEWAARHGHALVSVNSRARAATGEEVRDAEVWAIKRRIRFFDAAASGYRRQEDWLREAKSWIAGVRVAQKELLPYRDGTPVDRRATAEALVDRVDLAIDALGDLRAQLLDERRRVRLELVSLPPPGDGPPVAS
jgi:hypothetical protein